MKHKEQYIKATNRLAEIAAVALDYMGKRHCFNYCPMVDKCPEARGIFLVSAPCRKPGFAELLVEKVMEEEDKGV
jgi:hypothetical protein